MTPSRPAVAGGAGTLQPQELLGLLLAVQKPPRRWWVSATWDIVT